MPKFATKTMRPRQRAPITTTGPGRTHEGGLGATRDPKGELFLLAISNLVSEDTFYETGKARDERYAQLVHAVTNDDPEWVAALVPYLRNELNLRSVAVVTACEYIAAGGPFGRPVISAACQRPDEPAEVLAYWQTTFGRNLPMPVKRGMADAATRLYSERSTLRYDGTDRAVRFGDVIELSHPVAKAPWQNVLFKHLLDRRHGHDEVTPAELVTLNTDKMLREMDKDQRRANLGLAVEAGWSWERLASWLPGGMDAQAWEAIIPNMGYMALLRNLRNLDKVGLSDVAVKPIIDKLADPIEVLHSRQLPFRFYSAWREAGSLRWAYSIQQALEASLQNVPRFDGKTLVMVDTSGSMANQVSAKSDRLRYEIAALFGGAVAQRSDDANLVLFATGSEEVEYRVPLLRLVDGVRAANGRVGHGTATAQALLTHYHGHDRVLIFTDEQSHGDVGAAMDRCIKSNGKPPNFYTCNLGGYKTAHAASGTGRYTFGGLSDAGFKLISLLEGGKDGEWPHLAKKSE